MTTPAPPPPPLDAHPEPPDDDGRARKTRPDVPFSIPDGLLLVLWTIVAQTLTAIPFALSGVRITDGGPGFAVYLLVAQLVTIAVVVGWLRMRRRLDGRVMGRGALQARGLLVGLGAGLVAFIGINTLLRVGMQVFGPVPPPEQSVLELLRGEPLVAVVAVTSSVVFAPLIEELVFRGVLFQALRERIGPWLAALLSGLAFAAVHLEITQPLFSASLLLLGAWFAFLLHRSGSLLVPIAAHSAYNGITVMIALAVPA